jgi:hypothetical protein
MRRRIIQSAFAFVMLIPSALAQAGDWQAVKGLAPGTNISVKAGHFFAHTLCTVQRVNDDTLVCERIWHGPASLQVPSVHVFTYRRKTIREVRLEHGDKSNAAIGAAIGAGTGVAIGATVGSHNAPDSRQVGALLLGTLGGVMGGVFARDFPIVHGRVVYKQ